MLGDEHRMTAHGRLFAIALRVCGCEAFGDESRSMIHNGVEAPVFQIESGLIVQMKA